MTKYIIKNCPAFVLMRTGTNTTYFDMCGNAKGRIACKDCADCLLKRIAEKCFKVTNVYCQSEHFNPRYQDAKEILKLLEIEEVNE